MGVVLGFVLYLGAVEGGLGSLCAILGCGRWAWFSGELCVTLRVWKMGMVLGQCGFWPQLWDCSAGCGFVSDLPFSEFFSQYIFIYFPFSFHLKGRLIQM